MDVIQKKVDVEKLYGDVCVIIEQARDNAYRAVNVQLTLRNWLIGERVAKEELQGEARAAYGKQIISELSKKLTDHYGAGFDFSSIYQYIKFYRLFPQILDAVSPELRKGFGILGATNSKSDNGDKKVGSLRQQLLPWTHYRELIRVEDDVARQWYADESRREGWSSRTLHRNRQPPGQIYDLSSIQRRAAT